MLVVTDHGNMCTSFDQSSGGYGEASTLGDFTFISGLASLHTYLGGKHTVLACICFLSFRQFELLEL